jgi:hypothetical protein
MSDIRRDIPDTPGAAPEGSDEWGFENRSDELQDDAQAEASQYGRHGYQDQPGADYAGQGDVTIEAQQDTTAPQPQEDPTIQREQGGQGLTEQDHGSGFAQPMEGPQRYAHQSPLPGVGRPPTDE